MLTQRHKSSPLKAFGLSSKWEPLKELKAGIGVVPSMAFRYPLGS